jgi:hypothetical protein
VREFQERFATLRVADPVEKIFAALDMSIAFYVDDPAFYRTVWAAVLDVSDGVRGEILSPQRDAFWRSLVDDAVSAGAIAEGVDPALLLRQLEAILQSVMFGWVVGEIGPTRLGPIARHGYALLLRGAAAPDWRGPLRARVLDSQAALARVA